LTEWLRVEGGVANTFDSSGFINARASFKDGSESETEKTYMGLVTLTAPDSMGFLAKSQLYLGAVNGNGLGQDYHSTHWYAGANINTPQEGLKFAASFDYRDNKDGSTLPDEFTPANAVWAAKHAWAVAGYVIWSANDKLTFSDRVEYATADTNTSLGDDLKLFANTLTVDYKLWANVITRVEFRWDHSLDSDLNPQPFGDDDENAFSLALNVIYQF
jgi:hypothetical protein